MFGRIGNIGVRNLCKFDLNGLSHRSVNIKDESFFRYVFIFHDVTLLVFIVTAI